MPLLRHFTAFYGTAWSILYRKCCITFFDFYAIHVIGFGKKFWYLWLLPNCLGVTYIKHCASIAHSFRREFSYMNHRELSSFAGPFRRAWINSVSLWPIIWCFSSSTWRWSFASSSAFSRLDRWTNNPTHCLCLPSIPRQRRDPTASSMASPTISLRDYRLLLTRLSLPTKTRFVNGNFIKLVWADPWFIPDRNTLHLVITKRNTMWRDSEEKASMCRPHDLILWNNHTTLGAILCLNNAIP